MHYKFELRKKIIEYFTTYSIMKGDKFLEKNIVDKNKHHGSCCTCQFCFFDYEQCVCAHNEHLKAINEIFEYDEGEL